MHFPLSSFTDNVLQKTQEMAFSIPETPPGLGRVQHSNFSSLQWKVTATKHVFEIGGKSGATLLKCPGKISLKEIKNFPTLI